MKKLTVLLIVVLVLTQFNRSYSQIIGIKGGVNAASMLAKDDIGPFDTKMITGYNLAVTAEIPMSKMFSFETGLQLSSKGTKQTYDGGYGNSVEGSYKLTYLDAPLTAKVKFGSGGVKLFGLIGPYLGVGISGKQYDGGEGLNVKWGPRKALDIEAGIEDLGPHLKPLDYGLLVGAGAEIKSFQVGLNYGYGIQNLAYADDGMILNNRVLSLSVGYLFGKK